MREDDNEPVRRPTTHRVGEALDDCSVADLDARIVLLQAEIVRIETARHRKNVALATAGSLFKL